MLGYSSAETSSQEPKPRTRQPRVAPPRSPQLHRTARNLLTRSGRSYTMPRAFPLPSFDVVRVGAGFRRHTSWFMRFR